MSETSGITIISNERIVKAIEDGIFIWQKHFPDEAHKFLQYMVAKRNAASFRGVFTGAAMIQDPETGEDLNCEDMNTPRKLRDIIGFILGEKNWDLDDKYWNIFRKTFTAGRMNLNEGKIWTQHVGTDPSPSQ